VRRVREFAKGTKSLGEVEGQRRPENAEGMNGKAKVSLCIRNILRGVGSRGVERRPCPKILTSYCGTI